MSLPSVLDKYELRTQVGSGPFGTVYAAYDRLLGEERYLKVMHPERAQDTDFVEHWRQLMAQVVGLKHPGLVTPLDVNEDQGYYFTVLPMWPQNLRRRLTLQGPLAPEEAVALVRVLIPTLDEAHAHGLIHGDLKPENVLLDENDRPVLSDLGWMAAAVAAYGAALTDRVPLLSASPYVAPEVLQGQPLTPAADVYGLAQVLYEALSGHPWNPRVGEDLSAWGTLSAALQAGLQADPAQRPATPADWARLLPEAAQATAPATVAPPDEAAAPSPTQRPTPLSSEPATPQTLEDEAPSEEAEAFATAQESFAATGPEPFLTSTEVEAPPPQESSSLWKGCLLAAVIILLLLCALGSLGLAAWRLWQKSQSTALPTMTPGAPTLVVPTAPASGAPFKATPTFNPAGSAPTAWDPQQAYAFAQSHEPILRDDFSDPSLNDLPDDDRDDYALLDYDQGVYVIHVFPDTYIGAALFPGRRRRPVVIQVDLRLPNSRDLGDGSFGFVCGVQSRDNYYTMDISEDGYAALWKEGEELVALHDWEPLPEEVYKPLQQGQWITVTAVCDRGRLALWANGQFLIQGIDTEQPYRDGQVGLFVNTLDDPDLLVEFDNFALWELRP